MLRISGTRNPLISEFLAHEFLRIRRVEAVFYDSKAILVERRVVPSYSKVLRKALLFWHAQELCSWHAKNRVLQHARTI